MDIKLPLYNRCIGLSLTLALLSIPAQAAEPERAVQFGGIYEFQCAGITFGRAGIEAKQTASHYQMTMDVISSGILSVFVHHTSHTQVEASGADFVYPTIDYVSHYHTNSKLRNVSLSYHDKKLTTEELDPPEDYTKRPRVSEELKNASLDPLSFILKMRLFVLAHRHEQNKSFAINVYDGRRLTEADGTIIGPTTITYNNDTIPVIAVQLKRTLAAGFTQSELSKQNPNESGVTIYFTNDSQFIPVRLDVPMVLGTVSATLSRECEGNTCLLGNSN